MSLSVKSMIYQVKPVKVGLAIILFLFYTYYVLFPSIERYNRNDVAIITNNDERIVNPAVTVCAVCRITSCFFLYI